MRTPSAAKPPTVPGNGQAEQLAREALRLVVEHWPGDLRGVSLCVEQWPGHRLGATVKLAAHTPRPLGLLIGFSARELREGSPAVAQRIRVEHREWARVPTEGQRCHWCSVYGLDAAKCPDPDPHGVTERRKRDHEHRAQEKGARS